MRWSPSPLLHHPRRTPSIADDGPALGAGPRARSGRGSCSVDRLRTQNNGGPDRIIRGPVNGLEARPTTTGLVRSGRGAERPRLSTGERLGRPSRRAGSGRPRRPRSAPSPPAGSPHRGPPDEHGPGHPVADLPAGPRGAAADPGFHPAGRPASRRSSRRPRRPDPLASSLVIWAGIAGTRVTSEPLNSSAVRSC